MGNEESKPVDETVEPSTLTARTLEAVATYLKSDKVTKIVVMTGAGISTSAGIPDFRSPDTGLYANLARLDLPYPEAVFDISYFREHPEPFYALAQEFYPGNFRPTITHSFIRLLHDKGKLLKLFTQNIDCLEREAGVPGEKIIEAHGSFARQSCIECQKAYPREDITKHIRDKTIPRCKDCSGLVKPEITFFGENLPREFFENRHLPEQADLCIVMGTSLSVQPFASLPVMARSHTPRVLINMEAVGGLGSRADDVLILGDCDEGVRKLAAACGWLGELVQLWQATSPEPSKAVQGSDRPETSPPDANKELEGEIEKLTQEVDETLRLSKRHEEKVKNEHLQHEGGKGDMSHVFVSGHASQEVEKPKAGEDTNKISATDEEKQESSNKTLT